MECRARQWRTRGRDRQQRTKLPGTGKTVQLELGASRHGFLLVADAWRPHQSSSFLQTRRRNHRSLAFLLSADGIIEGTPTRREIGSSSTRNACVGLRAFSVDATSSWKLMEPLTVAQHFRTVGAVQQQSCNRFTVRPGHHLVIINRSRLFFAGKKLFPPIRGRLPQPGIISNRDPPVR